MGTAEPLPRAVGASERLLAQRLDDRLGLVVAARDVVQLGPAGLGDLAEQRRLGERVLGRVGPGHAEHAGERREGEALQVSVPTTTTKATNTSTPRRGVSGGRASTAARVTTPRIPAQPTSSDERHDQDSPIG